MSNTYDALNTTYIYLNSKNIEIKELVVSDTTFKLLENDLNRKEIEYRHSLHDSLIVELDNNYIRIFKEKQ